MNILTGVRPLDYLLAAVMVALAVLIGLENGLGGPNENLVHPLESHSALMVPVFVLAALPILWRRRAILPVIGVSLVVVAASVVAFGWVTRCGFALPLSAAMAYAVARFASSRQQRAVGLLGILALQLVTLVQDASAGLTGLVIGVPLAAAGYGIGLLVQSRSAKRLPEPTVAVEHVHA